MNEIIPLVRQGIAAALEVLDIASYSYSPSLPPTNWAAYVAPKPFRYHQDFEDGADLQFLVRFFAPSGNDEAAQELLGRWISPSGSQSAVALIEADPTLGGIVSSTQCVSMDNTGPLAFADGRIVQAAELTVSVLL
jgi:hypothetical protein